jgi:phosphotransferase system  glucose/maltose/N-acetylglucosamine-specific IIC component
MISEPRFTDELPTGEGSPGDDPVARLRLQLDELQAYVLQQWSARTDRVLLGFRRLAVLAVVAAVAVLALAAWIVMAVILLLAGATGGLATVLSGRLWLASLVVGGAAMALVILGVAVVYGVWQAASNQRTKRKYEERQREQRRRFGHSAQDRASGL